jgi:hypothetical protein
MSEVIETGKRDIEGGSGNKEAEWNPFNLDRKQVNSLNDAIVGNNAAERVRRKPQTDPWKIRKCSMKRDRHRLSETSRECKQKKSYEVAIEDLDWVVEDFI